MDLTFKQLQLEVQRRHDAANEEHSAATTQLDRTYALGKMVELSALLHWMAGTDPQVDVSKLIGRKA